MLLSLSGAVNGNFLCYGAFRSIPLDFDEDWTVLYRQDAYWLMMGYLQLGFALLAHVYVEEVWLSQAAVNDDNFWWNVAFQLVPSGYDDIVLVGTNMMRMERC